MCYFCSVAKHAFLLANYAQRLTFDRKKKREREKQRNRKQGIHYWSGSFSTSPHFNIHCVISSPQLTVSCSMRPLETNTSLNGGWEVVCAIQNACLFSPQTEGQVPSGHWSPPSESLPFGAPGRNPPTKVSAAWFATKPGLLCCQGLGSACCWCNTSGLLGI